MPTTTPSGIVIMASDLEPADLYGTNTRTGLSVEAVLTPEFTDVAFNGSWANYGSTYEEVAYAKIGNRVYLRGSAKHATTTTTGTVFTLPGGYAPAKDRFFVIPAGATGVFNAGIKIDSDGVVSVQTYGTSASAAYLGFDGVAFDTAD